MVNLNIPIRGSLEADGLPDTWTLDKTRSLHSEKHHSTPLSEGDTGAFRAGIHLHLTPCIRAGEFRPRSYACSRSEFLGVAVPEGL